jgi:hypothetical protein
MTSKADTVAPVAIVAKAVELACGVGIEAACRYLESQGDPLAVADQYAKAARSLYNDRKDVSTMLALGQSGVAYALRKALDLEASDAHKSKTLKEIAKTLAFNVSANAWPGWNDEGVAVTRDHIDSGLNLAQTCKRLVEELDLGPKRLANAYWLIGAHYLASGHLSEAAAAFDASAAGYRAAGDVAAEGMIRGYRALTQKLGSAAGLAAERELQRAYAELDAIGSDEARFYRAQISTADRVFSRSE